MLPILPFINAYPGTNLNELNLDWIISEVKRLNAAWDDFTVVNSIKFYGAWDITKQYPAYAIVNVNNFGFISKKPVPAGVDIESSEYWLLVADYSVLVAGMQERIIRLEDKVLSKDIIIIGDSYGVHNDIQGKFENALSDYTLHYNCISGNGVLSGNTFLATYNTVLSTIVDRDKVSHVILLGDYNDANRIVSGSNTVADYQNALMNLLNRINLTCKYAKILLIPCGIHFKSTDLGDFNRTLVLMPSYQAAAIASYSGKNAYVVPNSQNILQSGNLVNSSLFHPNDAGSQILVNHVKEALNGGFLECHYNGTASFTGESGISVANINWYSNNGITVYTTSSNALVINFESATNLSAGTKVKLAKFNTDYGSLPFSTVRISCLSKSSGVYATTILEITKDGYLYIIPGDDYTGITALNLYGVVFTVIR